MPPALVTYGWCRVSYVIAHALHARGVPVDATDAAALSMCRASRATRHFARTASPWTEPERFAQDVADACRAYGTRVLIPGHDDLAVLTERREVLPEGVTLVSPPPASLEIARSKLATASHAHSIGVAAPITHQPQTAQELRELAATLDYPAVVKPRFGNSAKGVTIAADEATLVAAHRDLQNRHGLAGEAAPLIQSFAVGEPVGVCALYNQGQVRAVFCERYLTVKDDRHGTSVLRESIYEPVLVDAAVRMLDSLQWHGVAHLDFHWSPGQEPVLLEINPRFWGALDLSVRSGVDFPWLLYRLALDGDVESVTDYRVGVRSRWAVGEVIRLAHRVARFGRAPNGGHAVGSGPRRRADGWDDLRRQDPLPLLVEALYYGRAALTGGLNPVDEGMIS